MDLVKWLRLQWDRAAAWLCVIAGAVVLIVGWVGVSGSAYSAEEMPYIISGGVGGVFLLGLGAMLWLSADLRDEWRKLDRIEGAIRERGILYVEVDRAGDGPIGPVGHQPYVPVPAPEDPTGELPLSGETEGAGEEPAVAAGANGQRQASKAAVRRGTRAGSRARVRPGDA